MQPSGNKQKSLVVPPRWLHCPRKGQLIANKFLPFKTPLDASYNDQIPEECRFDLDLLFMSLKSFKDTCLVARGFFSDTEELYDVKIHVFTKKGKPNFLKNWLPFDETGYPLLFVTSLLDFDPLIHLGLVVDLTNTARFYNHEEMEKYDCKYVKLQCKGRDETPTPEQTEAFVNICDQFFRRNPLHCIGVHCTHGFNRTGFLISAYLILKLDWSIEAAVSLFAEMRPPGIYKQDYLSELFARYGERDETPTAPPLPDWCLDIDDSDRDDDGIPLAASKFGGHESNSGTKRKREIKKMNALFMDGDVPGVTTVLSEPELSKIQQRVQFMCEWTRGGFPGAQPVSMDMKNLSLLSSSQYKVSWKADGTRYLMLVDGPDDVYMIDRDNSVFKVPSMRFPRRKEPSANLTDTLLDGEMVIDQVYGKNVPRFLVYDIIKFEKKEVGKTDFSTRLLCIEKEIVEPRNELIKAGLLDKSAEPFSVRAKPFWDPTSVSKILEGKFSQELSHKVDGLIFQPVKMPYVCGRCMEMLKWKPADQNSVDFRLKIVKLTRPGMLPETIGELYVGGMETPFSKMKVNKELRAYDNKIIECNYDATKGQWLFMRQRTDKSFPNSYDTALGVCNSIATPVTKEVLYDAIERHARKPPIKNPSSGSGNSNGKQHGDSNLMPPPTKVPKR